MTDVPYLLQPPVCVGVSVGGSREFCIWSRLVPNALILRRAHSIIEMQALVAEVVETFQFRLPAGTAVSDPKRSQVQRAPAGGAMVPLTRGKPELGPSLRLCVSLA